jgi:hypothetical protein
MSGKKNSKGQDLVHEGLITRFLENLMLPEETAIVHAPGYQWGNFPEAQGNNLPGKAAKEAALHPDLDTSFLSLRPHP